MRAKAGVAMIVDISPTFRGEGSLLHKRVFLFRR